MTWIPVLIKCLSSTCCDSQENHQPLCKMMMKALVNLTKSFSYQIYLHVWKLAAARQCKCEGLSQFYCFRCCAKLFFVTISQKWALLLFHWIGEQREPWRVFQGFQGCYPTCEIFLYIVGCHVGLHISSFSQHHYLVRLGNYCGFVEEKLDLGRMNQPKLVLRIHPNMEKLPYQYCFIGIWMLRNVSFVTCFKNSTLWEYSSWIWLLFLL